MITIFLFSSQPADESSRNSDGIVDQLIEWFVSDFDQLTANKQASLIDTLTVVVRKGAHMTEYAVLSVLIYHAAIAWNGFKSDKWRYIFAWLGATLYAATDELHQRFVSGRSGELRDVLIDSMGALLGVLLVVIIARLIRRNKQNVRSSKDHKNSVSHLK